MAKQAKQTLYDILGIATNADLRAIKQAYYSSARIYHPDKFGMKSEKEKIIAEDKFKQIQHAYDILNDEHKKANYDASLATGEEYIDTDDSYTKSKHNQWRPEDTTDEEWLRFMQMFSETNTEKKVTFSFYNTLGKIHASEVCKKVVESNDYERRGVLAGSYGDIKDIDPPNYFEADRLLGDQFELPEHYEEEHYEKVRLSKQDVRKFWMSCFKSIVVLLFFSAICFTYAESRWRNGNNLQKAIHEHNERERLEKKNKSIMAKKITG
ncbi:DnaJ [Acrasis kona]|uniref:DnaJ n=1 Tax=Acrasis kona TaxID=1008807 RepID=A0AAW2YZC9_9EUKA